MRANGGFLGPFMDSEDEQEELALSPSLLGPIADLLSVGTEDDPNA